MMLPMDDRYGKIKVFIQKRDAERKRVVVRNRNPLLNPRVYAVDVDDGMLHEYAENMIAKNMYAWVYEEGGEHIMMRNIIEHNIDDSERTGDPCGRV